MDVGTLVLNRFAIFKEIGTSKIPSVGSIQSVIYSDILSGKLLRVDTVHESPFHKIDVFNTSVWFCDANGKRDLSGPLLHASFLTREEALKHILKQVS